MKKTTLQTAADVAETVKKNQVFRVCRNGPEKTSSYGCHLLIQNALQARAPIQEKWGEDDLAEECKILLSLTSITGCSGLHRSKRP